MGAAERLAAEDTFARAFGGPPAAIVRAPGRVNLIGEHTDYNDGLVLPVAIDRELWMAVRANGRGRVRASSTSAVAPVEFDLDRFDAPIDGWGRHLQSVAWALSSAGHHLVGVDLAVASSIPLGAGLSSSAALGVAASLALAATGGFRLAPLAVARTVRRAENEWVGVASGIMDQLVVAAATAGHALHIDCRSLEYRAVPLPAEWAVVAIDTSTRRELATSAYNERRASCERAAAAAGVPSLRDLVTDDLPGLRAAVDERTFRRARHVVSENHRVTQMVAALEARDQPAVAALMAAGHRSLREDFEVSTPVLDAAVDAALEAGAIGARMTGAGFGGCAVALVAPDGTEGFAGRVVDGFGRRTGLAASVYSCRPVAGAGVVRLR